MIAGGIVQLDATQSRFDSILRYKIQEVIVGEERMLEICVYVTRNNEEKLSRAFKVSL